MLMNIRKESDFRLNSLLATEKALKISSKEPKKLNEKESLKKESKLNREITLLRINKMLEFGVI